MATRNEWDELQYHNKENQDRKLNDTDANDDGDNNATAHFTDCVALHNWARARSPVPCTFSSHSHLAQVRASSALSLHHHGHPCGWPLSSNQSLWHSPMPFRSVQYLPTWRWRSGFRCKMEPSSIGNKWDTWRECPWRSVQDEVSRF